MNLFDHRLLVVTGKGGVGRTTASIALALSAARAGRSVCLLELNDVHTISQRFNLDGSYVPQHLAPNVDVATLSAFACLDDFGRRKLKMNTLVRLLFDNRVMRAFVESVPGLGDLLQLGKVEDLVAAPLAGEKRYDLVVVDAPATGHGLTLLSAASSMAEMTLTGPFHDLADMIQGFLADRDRVGIIVTSLPEELPVNEALELSTALIEQGFPPCAIVVNQTLAHLRIDDVLWDTVRDHFHEHPTAEVQALARLGDRAATQLRMQRESLQRLAEAAPIYTLPRTGASPTVSELLGFGEALQPWSEVPS